jgi:hypothetical protein
MNVIRHSGWRREAPETRNPSVSSRWIAGSVMPGLDPGTGNDNLPESSVRIQHLKLKFAIFSLFEVFIGVWTHHSCNHPGFSEELFLLREEEVPKMKPVLFLKQVS